MSTGERRDEEARRAADPGVPARGPDDEAARPPRLLRRLLCALLPRGDREHLPRELDDLFARRARRSGRRRASRWYAGQLLSFAVRLRTEWLSGTRRVADRRLAGLGADLRQATRRLLSRPGGSAAAVLTLGIGLGGVATVYSAANWVLLRPVPGVHEPQGLVQIRLESNDGDSGFAWPLSQPDLESLAAGTSSVTSMTASSASEIHLQVPGGRTERLTAELVTPDYFGVLGVVPAPGRGFRPADHRGGEGPLEVVVSHRAWIRYWDGAPDAVGRPVRVNGRPFTVVGIAPAGFHGAELPGDAEAWFPSSAIDVIRPGSGDEALSNRGRGIWGEGEIFGRLAPGATVEQVEAEAAAVMATVREEHGMHSFLATHFIFRAYPGLGLTPWVAARVRRTLLILTAASALLLLLAMANVTSLALARAASRRPETAIRRALGASSARVAREPLLEGLLLGTLGGAAGLLVAAFGLRLFADARLSTLGASLEGIRLDLRVAAFTALLAVAAGLVAAVAPAVAAARQGALAWIHGARHEERSTLRLRSALVAAQVALSAVLLVGAGLFLRTVGNLRHIDLGFEPGPLLTFSLQPTLQGYDAERTARLAADVVDRLEAEPGVTAAGFAWPGLLQGWFLSGAVYPPGLPEGERPVIAARFDVSPGFLAALDARLVAGGNPWSGPPAAAGPGEAAEAGAVAGNAAAGGAGDVGAASEIPERAGSRAIVISESAARAAFPEAAPATVVGRTVGIGPRGSEQATVAGVLAETRLVDIRDATTELLVRRWSGPLSAEDFTVLVRAAVAPRSLFPRIHEIVRAVDPELPVYGLATVADQVDGRLVEERVMARLATTLAVIGLLLSAIGLYGVLGHMVTERTGEIGLRGVLGARPPRIVAGVVARGLALTVVGAVVGLLAAAGLARLIASRLHDVGTLDPLTYGGGLVLLVLVAAAASGLPAWRAMRVSPMVALRRS